MTLLPAARTKDQALVQLAYYRALKAGWEGCAHRPCATVRDMIQAIIDVLDARIKWGAFDAQEDPLL